jgi:hypothetical protein
VGSTVKHARVSTDMHKVYPTHASSQLATHSPRPSWHLKLPELALLAAAPFHIFEGIPITPGPATPSIHPSQTASFDVILTMFFLSFARRSTVLACECANYAPHTHSKTTTHPPIHRDRMRVSCGERTGKVRRRGMDGGGLFPDIARTLFAGSHNQHVMRNTHPSV